MGRKSSPFLLLVVILAAPPAGCGGENSKESCHGWWPAPPPGTTKAVFVDWRCPTSSSDGSEDSPFATIGAALEAAVPGSTILIAPGSYHENLLVDKAPLAIVGASPDAVAGALPVSVVPVDPKAAIRIVGPGGGVPDLVRLHGIRIVDPQVAGIWVHKADAEVTACHVSGSKAVTRPGGQEPLHGFGILATEGSKLTVKASWVYGSTRSGVHLSKSTAVLEDNVVENNGRGGIRLDDCTSGDSLIQANTVTGNSDFGIGIFSSHAVVKSNTVKGTTKSASGSADGIVASRIADSDGIQHYASQVQILENVVEANGRCGLLLDSGTGGDLRKNTVSDNDRAGVWVQSGAGSGLSIEENTIDGNGLIGVCVTKDATAVVRQNHVGSTRPAAAFRDGHVVDVAYGVGVFSGASATVESNTFGVFEGTGKEVTAHVLVDAAGTGTGIRDNGPDEKAPSITIVVQHQPAGVTVEVKDNEKAQVETFGTTEVTPYALDKAMTEGVTPAGLVGPGGGVPD